MRHIQFFAAVVLTAVVLGCGGESPNVENQGTDALSPPAIELDPVDPSIIVRPFTADEIRNEWVPGLRLLIRRSDQNGSRDERWTVKTADAEGAEIEYATLANNGSIVGEPIVERSTWVDLQNHASFPASRSTREWVERSTQLGEFEGWLYRVSDDDSSAVQEFFFVPALPGAPVHMRVLDGETTVFEIEQKARLRPNAN